MIDVERSIPAPASLERYKRWSGRDVLEALHRDFFGKCYLCERELPPGETQVDHRVPQCRWPGGARCWANLFPACAYCNRRRPRPGSGPRLLSPGEGIEQRVLQRVRLRPTGDIECMFVAVEPNDCRAQATADELQRLHSPEHARTHRTRLATIELLSMIRDRYLQRIYPVELEVLDVRKRRRTPGLAIETTLADLLSRRAPFTMLMRGWVHPALCDLFD